MMRAIRSGRSGLSDGLAQSDPSEAADFDTATEWLQMVGLAEDDEAPTRMERLGQDADLVLYDERGAEHAFDSRATLSSFLNAYEGEFGQLFSTRAEWLRFKLNTDWRFQAAAGAGLALAGIGLYHAFT